MAPSSGTGAPGATRALAAWVAGLSYPSLPPAIGHEAALCLTDYLGCALLGSTRRQPRSLLSLASGFGGLPSATIVGSSVRTSPPHAALVNGVAGSASPLLEDTAGESFGHPGVSVIPAALAIAEERGVSRDELLLAVVCGYEVAMRVGAAAGWQTFLKGWHPRGAFNVFGAAAAAGKVLGLSEDQLCAALGLAGVQAGGLAEAGLPYDGWYLLSGSAAQAGVLAALLAREGWTGGDTIVEGPKGYLNVVAAAGDPARITAGLGERFEIASIIRKRHACSSTMQSAVDAILELRKEHDLEADDVARIDIETMSLKSLLAEEYPSGPMEESLRYVAAVALADGQVQEAQFTAERRADPELRPLFDRVHVVASDDLTAELPTNMPAQVTLTLASGRQVSRSRSYPRGDPREPLSVVELQEKFRQLGGTVLQSSALEGIWAWTHGTGAGPVRDLMRLTSASDA